MTNNEIILLLAVAGAAYLGYQAGCRKAAAATSTGQGAPALASNTDPAAPNLDPTTWWMSAGTGNWSV